MPLTKRTARAVAKYGLDACNNAYAMNVEGYGARSITFEGPVTIKTTRQADAAIDAGRELAKRPEGRAAPVEAIG